MKKVVSKFYRKITVEDENGNIKSFENAFSNVDINSPEFIELFNKSIDNLKPELLEVGNERD